jgi:hypothetical protein
MGYKGGQFVSNIERGNCSIPPVKYALVAMVLNVSVKDLIKAAKRDLESHLIEDVKFGANNNGIRIDGASGMVIRD